MARDFDGSTDRIDYTNVLDAATTAQTWSFWIYPNSVATPQRAFCVHASGDSASRIFLDINTGSGQFRFRVTTSGTNITRLTDAILTASSWQHILVTWDGSLTASNVHIYRNNTEATYATTTNGTGSISAADGSWSIGGVIFVDTVNFNARFANFGFWDRELSAGEIKALSQRFAMDTIPSGLKWGPPLIRDQRDPISGQAGTLDGTTVIEHPRTIFPMPLFGWSIPAAAAATTGIMTTNRGFWGAI